MDWHKAGLSVLPKNLLSYIVGNLARVKFPAAAQRKLNQRFAKAFKLNMAEAEFPLSHYRTIEEVFTRKLKIGVRHWDSGYASPADGYVLRSEAVKGDGQALQIKGFTYALAELMYGSSRPSSSPSSFVPAWFTTIYLAPHNYHRVHTPVAATLTGMRYIPGKLWPVNDRFTKLVPQLLCQNERLVFELTTAGGGRLGVVMVGAFNVGRIFSKHAPGLTTNGSRRQLGRLAMPGSEKKLAISLATGAELGVFMLGSTVVVVCDEISAKEFQPRQITATQPVKVGEKL